MLILSRLPEREAGFAKESGVARKQEDGSPYPLLPSAPQPGGRGAIGGIGFRYSVRGVFGADAGREWSAIRNVARVTSTTLWQRGHCGFI